MYSNINVGDGDHHEIYSTQCVTDSINVPHSHFGMATFTITKGGAMYEASVGGLRSSVSADVKHGKFCGAELNP